MIASMTRTISNDIGSHVLFRNALYVSTSINEAVNGSIHSCSDISRQNPEEGDGVFNF